MWLLWQMSYGAPSCLARLESEESRRDSQALSMLTFKADNGRPAEKKRKTG